MRATAFLAAAATGLASAVMALDPIDATGNKFFNKNGTQFFMKGVAYQLTEDDPLVDADQCKRDIKLMQELGVNTIRVYHVDAGGKHDDCMNALADAGIYLMVDLDTYSTYITAEGLYWNTTQYDKYAEVMDAFHSYDNVLGFFVGNENIAKQTDSPAAPFIKAAARDMKTYRDKKGYRKIPVGYSAADIKQLRPMLQDYLTCGGDPADNVDFFGLNSYSWCDPSDFNTSSYDKLQEYATNFPVPIFFSETGCNVPGPRLFDDQDAIFSEPMVNDWSGAIVYEWLQEGNSYGLISYGPKVDGAAQNTDVVGGYTRKGTPTPITPDFSNLKNKWATIHPTGVKKSDYDPKKVSTRPCPMSTAGGWWEVNGNVKIPALDQTLTGTFTSEPTQTPTASGDSGNGTSGSGNKDEDSAAPMDKQITIIGAGLAAAILGAALML